MNKIKRAIYIVVAIICSAFAIMMVVRFIALPELTYDMLREAGKTLKTEGIEGINRSQIDKMESYYKLSYFTDDYEWSLLGSEIELLSRGKTRWDEIQKEERESNVEESSSQKDVNDVYVDSGLGGLRGDLVAPNDNSGPGPYAPGLELETSGHYRPFWFDNEVFLVDLAALKDSRFYRPLRSVDFPSYSEYLRFEEWMTNKRLATSLKPSKTLCSDEVADGYIGVPK